MTLIHSFGCMPAYLFACLHTHVCHSVILLSSDYNETIGLEYINSDIVNTCGNLLSRCTAPNLNPEQLFPRKCNDIYMKKFNATERQTFEDLEMLVCKYVAIPW